MGHNIQSILVLVTCLGFTLSCVHGIYCLVVYGKIEGSDWRNMILATFCAITLPSIAIGFIGANTWEAMGGAKGLPRVLGVIGFIVGIGLAISAAATFAT